MSADVLYDEHWLLSVSGTDHVAADPNFGFLKSRKVFFYDQAPIPLPTLPTITTSVTFTSWRALRVIQSRWFEFEEPRPAYWTQYESAPGHDPKSKEAVEHRHSFLE